MMALFLGLFALSMAQFTPSPFICPPKNFYDSVASACAPCTTAADGVCGALDNTCQSFWYDSAGPACNDCTLVANADTSKTSVAPTECACQDQYFWQSSSNTCVACDSSSDAASCTSCNNIFDGTTCKHCSAIDNSNDQYDPISKGCFCKPGFAWDEATFSCIICSSVTNPDRCKAKSCPSFFWNTVSSTCVQCSTIDNTNPAINNKAYGLETCACFVGFGWSATSNSCV